MKVKKKYIVYIIFILSLYIIIINIDYFINSEKQNKDDCLVTSSNLIYSKYNYTTNQIEHMDSGIPIYTNRCKNNKLTTIKR